jgi:hypothetical protein
MLAQAIDLPFDLTQPAGQFLAVVFFLIPGLNVTWMMERLAGRTTLGPTERLLRAVALSVFIYALASPWLLRLGRRLLSRDPIWPWEPIAGFSVLLFLAPPLIGLAWVNMRRSHRLRRFMARLTDIDPSPTSWDFVFSQGRPFLVKAKLRDGERVGGLFGLASNASFYPEAQDLYLEEAWELDHRGGLLGPIDGSEGLLIPHGSVEVLELLAVELEEEDEGSSEEVTGSD